MKKVDILGIDLGNNYVKTSENVCFPAKTSLPVGLNHPNQYNFDGQDILISCGYLDRTSDKVEKQNILPLLYLAIYKSTLCNSVKVVIGLPISQFKRDKDVLKDYIMSHNKKQIADRIITIEDCFVVPEGSSVIFNISDEDSAVIGDEDILIVDIGGGTTDTVLQQVNDNRRIISGYLSKYTGINHVIDDVAEYVTENYMPCNTEKAEKIIQDNGFKFKGDFKSGFIKNIITNRFNQILQTLNAKYTTANGYIYLTGGGSQLFLDNFKEHFKNYNNIIVSKNPFFDNATAYKKVGESLWQI